jgi:hypothetical protein
VNNAYTKLVLFAMLAILCLAAGCSKKAEAPPVPPGGKPPLRANDPNVMNNPNIPEGVKQQIRGGAGGGRPAPPGPR